MRAFWIFILTLTFVHAAHARPLTREEQSSLNQTRDRFIEALTSADYEAVVDVIPPRVLSHIARTGGMPEAQLRAQMPKLMATIFSKVDVQKMEMRTEGIEVTTSRGKDGTAYVWGFAPTSLEMSSEGEKLTVNGHTLALREKGKWFLVRTNDVQQVTILKTVYPFLQQADFPDTE